MQRYQVLGPGGQSKYRELDHFVSRVIWEAQHFRRCHHECGKFFRRKDYKVRGAGRTAQQAGSLQQAERCGLAGAMGVLRRRLQQRDPQVLGLRGEAVRWQPGIGRIHETKQLTIVALEMDPCPQEVHASAKPPGPLTEGIGLYFLVHGVVPGRSHISGDYRECYGNGASVDFVGLQ
jgi:hypothetical protein